jgi:hypothetical protein
VESGERKNIRAKRRDAENAEKKGIGIGKAPV